MPYKGLRTVNPLTEAVGKFKLGKVKLLCLATGPFITMEGQKVALTSKLRIQIPLRWLFTMFSYHVFYNT